MALVKTYYEPKYLYRYRNISVDKKFRSEISAIKRPHLWSSEFRELNDPMEGAYKLRLDWENNRHYELIREQIFGLKAAVGICSFSETHNHELMWAHYADQFRGICIEYNFSNLQEALSHDFEFARLFYSEEIHHLAPQHLDRGDIARRILSTKNYRWLYEREWRLFAPNKGTHLLSPAEPRRIISQVYMGNRIDRRKEDILRRTLEELRIPCLKMNIDGYRIKFSKLRD